MVRLDLALAPDLPWIEADASQIQQIVMNLVINAAEAIGPERGTVSVSTGVAEIESGDERPPGRYVYLEVRDSGCGMDEATRAKIFDPFFTTKFAGRGLGLAAVAGILRGHRGRLDVESIPGEGTMFTVFFPAVDPILPQVLEPPSSVVAHGGGTLLFVDDEPILRKMGKRVLEKSGYSVLLAENGREAVEIFRHNSSEIAIVLLDLTMPVMSVTEALRMIREMHQDV